MADTRYLIAIDVGTALTKAAVLEKDAIGRQWIAARRIVMTAIPEQSITMLIEELMEIIRQLAITNQVGSTDFDLAVVGHPPDVPVYSQASKVVRFSHEDALMAVARRQSAEGAALIVDIGCHRTMVALAKYGKVSVETFDYGVGEQSWPFLRQGNTAEQLRAWLPFDMAEGLVADYIATKSLYPSTIPTTTVELAIEQALAKMILRQVEARLPVPWQDLDQLIVSGGVLSQPAHDPQIVACILDGLQPTHSFQLLSDDWQLLYALGGAFETWSDKDYSIGRALLRSSLKPVARLVCLADKAEPNSKGASGKGKLAKIVLDAGLSTEQALEVKADEVVVVPWANEEIGQMTVKGGSSLAKEPQTIAGGSVGLVIDGRSRPILLSRQEKERRVQLLNWDKQLNVHQQVGMLEEAMAKVVKPGTPKTKASVAMPAGQAVAPQASPVPESTKEVKHG